VDVRPLLKELGPPCLRAGTDSRLVSDELGNGAIWAGISADEHPALTGLAARLAHDIGGRLDGIAATRFTALSGSALRSVFPDSDHLFHLVIRAPAGIRMVCGNERPTLHQGEIWWRDHKPAADSEALSAEACVQAVFAIAPQPAGEGMP
jgi:hypothetical protein